MHGGDIYSNNVNIDFSVNVNPLGMPADMKAKLQMAIDNCEAYPDYKNVSLTKAWADALGIDGENIIFGNGASEIFSVIAGALGLKKVILPCPSFTGYEHSFSDCEIIRYRLREEDGFKLDGEFIKFLREEVKGENAVDTAIVLTNPNNPTGRLIDNEIINEIIDVAHLLGIYVIFDECFLGFDEDFMGRTKTYDAVRKNKLIIVNACTKLFAIPGVRLGFAVANKDLIEKIKRKLPEWNVSVFAQSAGVAAAKHIRENSFYLQETRQIVKTEREFLTAEIAKIGIEVFETDTCFMLLKTKQNLYDELLKRKILIRKCDDYYGLDDDFYRIAVKDHEKNKHIIDAMKDAMGYDERD